MGISGLSLPPAALWLEGVREANALLAAHNGVQFGISLVVAVLLAVSQPADTVAGMQAGSLTDAFLKQAVVSSAGAQGRVPGARLLMAGCAAVGEARTPGLGATPRWETHPLRAQKPTRTCHGVGWWWLGPAEPSRSSTLPAWGQ